MRYHRQECARRRTFSAARRDESGESLALLVVWPALLTAILLMLVHAFIVTNARAEAELAASHGLRSAWRVAADSDFLTDPDDPDRIPYGRFIDPHPDVLAMAEAAKDAVALTAATEGGWRWWSPGAAELHSDWCYAYTRRPTPISCRASTGRPAIRRDGCGWWCRARCTGRWPRCGPTAGTRCTRRRRGPRSWWHRTGRTAGSWFPRNCRPADQRPAIGRPAPSHRVPPAASPRTWRRYPACQGRSGRMAGIVTRDIPSAVRIESRRRRSGQQGSRATLLEVC